MEILEIGSPERPGRPRRRTPPRDRPVGRRAGQVLLGLLVGSLVVAAVGFGASRVVDRRQTFSQPESLAALQTMSASATAQSWPGEAVDPSTKPECGPLLLEAGNGAVDNLVLSVAGGSSNLGAQLAVWRYPTPTAARAELAAIGTALDRCDGRSVQPYDAYGSITGSPGYSFRRLARDRFQPVRHDTSWEVTVDYGYEGLPDPLVVEVAARSYGNTVLVASRPPGGASSKPGRENQHWLDLLTDQLKHQVATR